MIYISGFLRYEAMWRRLRLYNCSIAASTHRSGLENHYFKYRGLPQILLTSSTDRRYSPSQVAPLTLNLHRYLSLLSQMFQVPWLRDVALLQSAWAVTSLCWICAHSLQRNTQDLGTSELAARRLQRIQASWVHLQRGSWWDQKYLTF